MNFDDIKDLTLQELEKLLANKFRSLHLLNIMEDEIIESGISRVELFATRDQILDDILLIQALLQRKEMTQSEISNLNLLIDQVVKAKPELDPDVFMNEHWRPFLKTLSQADRRMAWQVYLRAQVKHLHAIVDYVQSLPSEKINALRPALENLASLAPAIENFGNLTVPKA